MATGYDELIENAHKLPLSAILPRVLRLAESTADKDFATWVRLELLGYLESNPAMTDKTVVPEYRTVGGQWFDAYGRRLVFENPDLGFINETRLRSGVAELESFVGATGVIAIQIPELSDIIRQNLNVDVTTFVSVPKRFRRFWLTSRRKFSNVSPHARACLRKRPKALRLPPPKTRS
jgi:AbiTii